MRTCPKCGTQNSANALFCRICGQKFNGDVTIGNASVNRSETGGKRTKGLDEKYCESCGSIINIKAEICPHCGVRQIPKKAGFNKSKTTAGILAIFLGGLGIHKFYLGKSGQAVFYILFCWTYVPAIIGLIEGITYLCWSEEKFMKEYAPKK